jgi:glycine cleavage system H protein
MEGFSYHDIFETKGIEYLAIIAFLTLLIPFWVLLNKQSRITKQIKKGLHFLSVNILKIPQGIYYCKNHTWAFLEKSGAAKVGLDDLLLHMTGQVTFSNLKNPGDMVSKGDPIAELNQNGRILSIYSPISGKIMDNNTALSESPEILHEDPYGQGWLFKIKPTNWKLETSAYYLAEEATNWSTKEVDRFKDFLAFSSWNYSPDSSPLVLQDGGEIRDNALAEMPDAALIDFQKDFLSVS